MYLNANDANTLVEIATSKTYLGKAAVGEQLFLKALRLTPYQNTWYFPYGALTYFFQQKYDKFFETALKGPLDIWVDLPAFLAAAYANVGNQQEGSHYLNIFINTFTEKILFGRRPQSWEIIDWLKKINPFKHESDSQLMIQGIISAGLEDILD